MANTEIKINVPEGMEIDKENSTFECIKFKKKIDFIPQKGDFIYIATTRNYWYLCIYDHMDGTVINGYLIQDDGGRVNVQTKTLPIIRMGEVADIKLASCYQVQDILDHIDKQGYEWSDGKIQKKPSLPKTWEEFCINTQIKEGECYLDTFSTIHPRNCGCNRNFEIDKNILPNKETAEAMLALCQLIQLRDCYNDGWKADWKNNDNKYCIERANDDIVTSIRSIAGMILAFKTAELRDQFLENFRDLIKIAKPLI